MARYCPRYAATMKVDPMNHPVASRFIDRSRNVPLCIELIPHRGSCMSSKETTEPCDGSLISHLRAAEAYAAHAVDIPGFIAPLLPYADKWGSLTVEARADRFRLFHLPSVPKLQSLRLLVEHKSRISATVRSNFCEGLAPSLSVLDLRRVIVPLTSPIYHGLKQLILEGSKDTIRAGTTIELLNALAQCPLLEKLHLRGVCFATGPPTAEHPTIALQHLQFLRLSRLDAALQGDILLSIIAPRTVRLWISIHGEGTIEDVFPSSLNFQKSFPHVPVFAVYASRLGLEVII
ncbi:hypothetical protein BOTBODRAFT_190075 [Botryobasidium botryosum FD-172 SS1]|uniref:F-box domain-containing protein n=1 Tax=Botryobasidium botryosum (strain FD-172 SS1) TaxID=930990 RepID=A0A067M6D1_BOTB1|nr:hypothetical protein BOTBODRAFT_190075 [Botryobasidium botryosum FD-172 SS1]